jgi:hypothetical protein
MGSKIITSYLHETEYDRWNTFVSKSPDGSIYSTPEYLDILCQAGGGKFKILTAKKGDEILGGVGLYERESTFGTYVSPRLLLYYNGLVLQNCQTKYPSQHTSRHLKIMAALEDELSNAKYSSLHLKNRGSFKDARLFLQKGWNARLTYTYVVDCQDLDALKDRIEQNLRRLINRCSEQSFLFTEDDDFDSLFQLHAKTHERKGAPIYLPLKQFKRYFERLKSKNLCRLYHARLPNGQSVSSLLVLLGPHSVSHSVCAGTDDEHLNSGTGVFLRWKVFEDLFNLGYKANDLTDAALNPVTRFKSQLGAELQTCLVLSKPESFAFRTNRAIQNLRIKCQTYASNTIKKVIGRKVVGNDFKYWQ